MKALVKGMMIVGMIVLLLPRSFGQTLKEWLQQKKTQKQYLLQQIAAQQVYLDFLKKGYRITRTGLHTIGALRQGEFDLHAVFFNSLKTAGLPVKRYGRISEIILLQGAICREYDKARVMLQGPCSLSANEQRFTKKVFSRMLSDCSSLLEELLELTANNQLELDDAQRIVRIDRIYADMLERFTFSKSFAIEVLSLCKVRQYQDNQVESARHILGIKDVKK